MQFYVVFFPPFFPSFLLIYSAINDTYVILVKKIDEILHNDPKHLYSKTSTKVFETESKYRKPKPSINLTSKRATLKPFIFNYSEQPDISTIQKISQFILLNLTRKIMNLMI